MKYGFIVLLLALLLPLELSASCGSATCPLNSFERNKVGQLAFGLAYEYIDQDRAFVGTSVSYVGAIRGHHDEVRTLNQRWIIRSGYAFSPEWQVRAELPFIQREHTHIHHHHGQDLTESWNFSGVGDAGIFLDYTLPSPHTSWEDAGYMSVLSFTAGLTLPTGVTTMTNSDGDEAEASIQPGSGGYSGSIGVYYRQPVFPMPTLTGKTALLALIGSMTFTTYGAGTNGWKFGDSFVASVGADYTLWDRSTAFLQLDSKFQRAAEPGTTREPISNTGGYWLYLSPGLKIALTETLSFNGIVQFPIYQRVNGIQLVSACNLQVGVTGSF